MACCEERTAKRIDEQHKLTTEEENEAIEAFLGFLRIETVSGVGPQGAYDECAAWLTRYFTGLGLQPFVVEESLPGKPVLVCQWQGTDATLEPGLVNCHYDGVPAMLEHWTRPPFAPQRSADGRIYARGAQDMKC